jgi:hypothetical protein
MALWRSHVACNGLVKNLICLFVIFDNFSNIIWTISVFHKDIWYGRTIWSRKTGPIVLGNNKHCFLLFFWEIYGGGDLKNFRLMRILPIVENPDNNRFFDSIDLSCNCRGDIFLRILKCIHQPICILYRLIFYI